MIRFVKLRDVKSPCRGSRLSAGIDFFVPNEFTSIEVLPGEDVLIPSGIRIEIPEHCCLLGIDKSGIASSMLAKKKVGIREKNINLPSAIIVGAKLIDADYPGEVHIHLINVGSHPILIEPGVKIAQFIILPVFYDQLLECKEEELSIPGSERIGGFGSTGK